MRTFGVDGRQIAAVDGARAVGVAVDGCAGAVGAALLSRASTESTYERARCRAFILGFCGEASASHSSSDKRQASAGAVATSDGYGAIGSRPRADAHARRILRSARGLAAAFESLPARALGVRTGSAERAAARRTIPCCESVGRRDEHSACAGGERVDSRHRLLGVARLGTIRMQCTSNRCPTEHGRRGRTAG